MPSTFVTASDARHRVAAAIVSPASSKRDSDGGGRPARRGGLPPRAPGAAAMNDRERHSGEPHPAAHGLGGDRDLEDLAAGYRNFATNEAAGRSPLYAELAAGVTEDRGILAWLSGLPQGKRQPNLLFAAVRALTGTPSGWPEFRAALLANRDAVEALVLARRTQTNEPARCATLLPLLAALPQPLALLEVGASAGLCLLPDRYAYDYAGHRLGERGPRLRCRPEGPVPLPDELPRIAWRAGLDLDPVDLTDDEQVRWLELLVWPGQEHRLAVLRDAIEVARADPPRVVRGDLTSPDVAALAAEAPAGATLVIFHTAVLAYVPTAGRAAFAATVRDLDAVWIANEAPGILGLEDGPPGLFAITRDGEQVAWADPHGAALTWLR
jgi:hypothetical protein